MRPIRPTTAVAAALASLLLSACSSAPETRIDPEAQLELYRETALFHYEDNNLQAAENQAIKGLQLDEEDKTLRLMLGWILLRRGDPVSLDRAQAMFRDYIADYDDEHRALLGLAGTMERVGAVQLANAGAIERGERLPDRGSPEKRAKELRRASSKSWKESYELYERAFDLRDDSLDAIDGLQRVAARRGNLEESLEWSNELLGRASAERSWYRGRLETADLDEREERRLREGERGAAQLMANTQLFANAQLVSLGRLEQAVAALDAALELDPMLVDAYSRRAQLRYLLGDFTGASSDIQQFISSSSLPTDHPDVVRAFDLLEYSEREDPTLDWVAMIGPGAAN